MTYRVSDRVTQTQNAVPANGEIPRSDAGDPGGTRTPNTQFRRLMLYPLSYRAISYSVAYPTPGVKT